MTDSNHKRIILAGTVAGWYQQACTILSGLIVIPFITRALQPEAAGIWFSFISILAFLMLSDFGLSFVIARQISYSLTADKAKAAGGKDLIQTRAGWLGVADTYEAGRRIFNWVVIAGVAFLLFTYFVILHTGTRLVQAHHETAVVWICLGASTLLSIRIKPHQAMLEGLAKVHIAKTLAGSYQILRALAILLVLLLNGGLKEMSIAVLAVTLIYYAAYRGAARRSIRGKMQERPDLPAGFVARFLKIAAPMGALMIGTYLTSVIQIPLVGVMLGAQLVAGFYTAQKIGEVLNIAVSTIVHPQLPLFTSEIGSGSAEKAHRRFLLNMIGLSLLSLLLNVCYVFAGRFVLDLMVGQENTIPKDVMLMMALNFLLMTIAVVPAQFVLAAGSNPFVFSTILNGLLNVLLCMIIVPAKGLIGIPIAGIIAGMCTNYWYAPYKGLQLLRSLHTLRINQTVEK